MSLIISDAIFLRRPKFDYISPPVCETFVSGSSFPICVVNATPLPAAPTGLMLVCDGETATLSWDAHPLALKYIIYKADDTGNPTGSYTIFADCVEGTSFTVPCDGCYRVSAITLDGESELSEPVCGSVTPPIEVETEVCASTDDSPFGCDTEPLETSSDPVLTLNISSTLTNVILNWDALTGTDIIGLPGNSIKCYKVRGTAPIVGNYSNTACAVRNMIFLGVGAVSYPTWQLAFGDLQSDDITLVTSLDLSGLRAVIGGTLYLDASFALTSLDLTNLIAISGEFHLSLTTITTLSLPNFTTLGGDLFFDNTALVSLSMPMLTYLNGNTYAFDSSALDAASVEGILARAVVSGVTSATIQLDGGTNAPLSSLSAQGQIDYAALVLAGNTMSINP